MMKKDHSQFFRKVRSIEVITSKLLETLLSGNYRSVFKGRGMEFDEVREYIPGDDTRFIDWNVTSRMDSPYTKTFREERELTLFLVTDVSASVLSFPHTMSKHETASWIFATFALSAVKNNDKVGALFFSEKIERWVKPASGKKHALRLINDLLIMNPDGKGSDLNLALRTAGEILKKRSICIIISDFKTANYWTQLSNLSRRHDVVAVKVFDSMDRNFPKVGLIELVDSETEKTILASGSSSSFRKSYRDLWEQNHLIWEANCQRWGVDTVTISTKDDAGIKLFQYFRRRRKK